MSASLAKLGRARRIGVPVQARTPASGDRGHDVLDLEADLTAAGEWDLAQRRQFAARALGSDQMIAFDVDAASAWRGASPSPVLTVGSEEDHLPRTDCRHPATIGSAAFSTA